MEILKQSIIGVRICLYLQIAYVLIEPFILALHDLSFLFKLFVNFPCYVLEWIGVYVIRIPEKCLKYQSMREFFKVMRS
jgi:hypothetical protein